jgi:hypothetical protein
VLPAALGVVPVVAREAVVVKVAAGVKVAAEAASRMKKVVAMEAVVVVQAEAMEVAAGALKRTAVAMEAGALMLKAAAATDEAAGASTRLAAAKKAVALKAFDRREKSESGKGGLRVCWFLGEERRRSAFLFPCRIDHCRHYR